MEPQTAARYRLLDELRGLDLISMMLYHGMWDVVFLFGVARVVHRTPGLCVAAEHLLGLYPAFGLLPAAGASSVPAGSRRLRGRGAGHSRHPALPARGRGVVRGADLLARPCSSPPRWTRCFAASRPPQAWPSAPCSFWVTYPTMNGFWNLPGRRLALPQASTPATPRPIWDLCRRAFSPPTISRCCPGCFCSGRGTSSTTRGPGTPRAAAPVGLPAAGLDGPSLAGALSAPSAGHPGGADGGVPAGESGVKLLEKLASVTA